jgi:hypothetical protein
MADASVREILDVPYSTQAGSFHLVDEECGRDEEIHGQVFHQQQGLFVRKSLTAIAVLLSTGKRQPSETLHLKG